LKPEEEEEEEEETLEPVGLCFYIRGRCWLMLMFLFLLPILL